MENGVSLEGLRAAAQNDVRALRNEITTLSDAQISLILTQATEPRLVWSNHRHWC